MFPRNQIGKAAEAALPQDLQRDLFTLFDLGKKETLHLEGFLLRVFLVIDTKSELTSPVKHKRLNFQGKKCKNGCLVLLPETKNRLAKYSMLKSVIKPILAIIIGY